MALLLRLTVQFPPMAQLRLLSRAQRLPHRALRLRLLRARRRRRPRLPNRRLLRTKLLPKPYSGV